MVKRLKDLLIDINFVEIKTYKNYVEVLKSIVLNRIISHKSIYNF